MMKDKYIRNRAFSSTIPKENILSVVLSKVEETANPKSHYRVTRRVFSEPVTSKLHILSPNILAGHLKASEVTWISAMHSIFSHPPAHSGPISFSKVENLKLASGTNKSK